MPEISIKAQAITEIYGFKITNSFVASIIVLFFFLIVALSYKRETFSKNKSGFFYFFQFFLKAIYDLFESLLKDKADYFFALLGTIFIFVILQNWFGLLPGVGSILIVVHEGAKTVHIPLLRGDNADLNTTLALAILVVFLIQFFGIKFLGVRGYLGKFINFKNPINFFVGLLEIVSEFSKVISFSFRLFGNIFAGEVLLTIIAFLVPVLASFPFLLLEMFVGFIQAIVFSMLTAIFLNLAIAEHH